MDVLCVLLQNYTRNTHHRIMLHQSSRRNSHCIHSIVLCIVCRYLFVMDNIHKLRLHSYHVSHIRPRLVHWGERVTNSC